MTDWKSHTLSDLILLRSFGYLRYFTIQGEKRNRILLAWKPKTPYSDLVRRLEHALDNSFRFPCDLMLRVLRHKEGKKPLQIISP